MSTVDVVVPCYKYGHYLPACIDSILSQGVDVRALIIDDASPDDSADVAERLAQADSRVQFIRHAQNRGHIDTYNEGLIGWAQAPYSLLLSADDLLAPGALRRAVDVLDAHPGVGMVYGMAVVFSDSATLPPGATVGKAQIIPGSRLIQRVCARGNGVPTPTAVVRTGLQKKVGGYRKDLPHSGDMEMWLRFAIAGSIGIIDAVQAFYRVHGGNMSTQYYQMAIRDRREQLLACQQAQVAARDSIPGFAGWLQDMSTRFGEECFWAGSHAFDRGELKMADECLQQAVEFDPAITKSRMWMRYRIKRLLGPTLWKQFAKLLPGRGQSDQANLIQPHFSPAGAQIGWWPDPTGA